MIIRMRLSAHHATASKSLNILVCTGRQFSIASCRPIISSYAGGSAAATRLHQVTCTPQTVTLINKFRNFAVGNVRCISSRAGFSAALERHNEAVKTISATMRGFYERKEKFRINHGSTNSTRNTSKGKNTVDTSRLSYVLNVDIDRRVALVEPNVPMDRLVEETLKYGLVPPVVMEFPGITVGGGYAGTSGESSSFRHGFFNRTINYVEMVLANGDVVTTSESERPDLFHGAAGAVGTLGVTTLVELQLIEAKKFVETTYHPISGGISEAIQKIKEATADHEIDYVDGIMFSKFKGAIITGRLTNDAKEHRVQRFSHAWDPWFYLHVKDTVKDGATIITEAIPLTEYLFRYDRGGFWVGASAFRYFHAPFNRLTRWFLDDFLHTRMLYAALHASGQDKQYIVQDLALPYSTAEQFVEYTDAEFRIYPLWLCPLKQSPQPTFHPHFPPSPHPGSAPAQKDLDPEQPLLNIGLWGFAPTRDPQTCVAANRSLEAKLRELKGMKWLYAHTYYTADEFWGIYDRAWYDALREKYGALTLPSVWEKVTVREAPARSREGRAVGGNLDWVIERVRATWPLSGLWGIWRAIRSGSFKEARKAKWRTIDVPIPIAADASSESQAVHKID
jgi:FAD/FMN-containing dehydrogenase